MLSPTPVHIDSLFCVWFQRSVCVFWPTGMSLTPDLSDAASIPEDVVVRRMVALFDYDPWESSPNVDSEVSATMTPYYVFNHFLQILSYYCFKYNKVVCGDVSRLFLSLKGWTWLPFRRHHICVRWHGSRRILLCECQYNDWYLVLMLTFAHKFNFHLNFRGIFTDDGVWFHQTSCSRYPGIKRKRLARMFAQDAKSQTQWEISRFY